MIFSKICTFQRSFLDFGGIIGAKGTLCISIQDTATFTNIILVCAKVNI